MVVEKKILPEYFQEVLDGNKSYELRLADFDINPGDTLKIREWNPNSKEYTGRELERTVGYVGRVSDVEKMYTEADIKQHGLVIISLK